MQVEEKISNTALRLKLPTVIDQYRFAVKKLGLYLPKWDKINKRPKWATEKYMVGLILKRTFGIKKESVKEPVEVTRKFTKGQMLKILAQLVDKPIGFETDAAPPKDWLVKVIYSLNPNHEMFRPVEEEIKVTIPEE